MADLIEGTRHWLGEQADACYRSLAHTFAKNGVGRAPIDYQDYHMAVLMPAFRETCAAIKTALGPDGIIAPGRYGIGAATRTSDPKATNHEEVTRRNRP